MSVELQVGQMVRVKQTGRPGWWRITQIDVSANGSTGFCLGDKFWVGASQIEEALPVAFPVGSVVWLKSGSPPLIVESCDNPAVMEAGGITVEWFEGDILRHHILDRECLTTEKPNG